jgi:flagellar basal-body rod modification protein FlgD
MEITATNSATYPASSDRVPLRTLGQEEFLKLLATQMTTQDPMNPQKDTDFIAQMAQFSALEQSRSMQEDIALMRGQQQLLQANSLLGKIVDVRVDDTLTVRGTVSEVQIESGTPKLIVDGQEFGLDQVVTITPTATQHQTSTLNKYVQFPPNRR